LSQTHLHKVLTRYAGPTWDQEFEAPDLDIHEKVPTPVPPLLDEDTLKAIRERMAANRTYHRRSPPKHQYLLAGKVICAHCGFAMFGMWDEGKRYYRHVRPRQCADVRKNWTCPDPWAKLRADPLESAVVFDLFDLFGNPARVARAVEDACPSPGKAEDARREAERLGKALDDVGRARDRVVRTIARGCLTEAQADRELVALKGREDALRADLDRVTAELEGVPDPEEVRKAAEALGVWVRGRFHPYVDPKLVEEKRAAATDLAGMSFEDKRALVETAFTGRTPAGVKTGIYVSVRRIAFLTAVV
jgi:hypothetical protein